MQKEHMVQVGDVLQDRYEILQNLGKGRLVVAWIAYDKVLERRVVVKTLQEKYFDNPRMRQYLQNGARTLARFLHPNIMPVYDRNEDDELSYTVTAYIEDAMSIVSKAQQVSLIDKLRLLQQLASAIDYLHSHDRVHRNVVSNNILVGDDNQLFLLDFDLAVPVGFKEETDVLVGKMPYISSENIQVDGVQPSEDMFAFGIVCFESFTGRKPSGIEDKFEAARTIMTGGIPSVREHNPELPVGIDVVIQRLCANQPEERYQTATQAVDDMYEAIYSGQSEIEGTIFISHASKDKDYVSDLVEELQSIRLNIWIDHEGIKPATTWAESIQDALNSCEYMLLIVTDASMASDYVTYEWSYFMGRGKPVYPFVPGDRPQKIHPRLEHIQHINSTGDLHNDVFTIVGALAGADN